MAADSVEAKLTTLASADEPDALVAFCENFELDLGHASLPAEVSLHVYKVRATSPRYGGRARSRGRDARRRDKPASARAFAAASALCQRAHACTVAGASGKLPAGGAVG